MPAFAVRTPEDFLELLRLRRPDPGTGAVDMAKLGEWLAAHPEAQTATMASLSAPPPASYAQLAYHALHAYVFVDAHGNRQYGRYHWQPEDGEASLANDEEAASKSHDYLQEELRERLAAHRVGFTLEVQLADEDDPTDDPTVVWDDDRRTIDVGRLEIQAEAFDRDTGDDILVFDPSPRHARHRAVGRPHPARPPRRLLGVRRTSRPHSLNLIAGVLCRVGRAGRGYVDKERGDGVRASVTRCGASRSSR